MKRRADGRYLKQIVVGYNDDGYPIRKSVYGKTQKEVEDKILELKGQLKNGVRLDNDMTFRDAVELYLARPLTETTLHTYRSRLKPLAPLMYIKVKNLNALLLQNQLEQLSPASQNHALILCNSIMKFLMDNDVIQKNPFRGLKTSHDPKRREALTLEQQQIILDAPSCREKNALLLMMLCGLRIGEALAITRRDIHDGKVYVTKQINSFGKEVKPKTKSSVREVPCPSLLYKEIKDMIVIVPHSRDTIAKYIKSLGLDITPHQLRHTYATNLFNSDVNVKTAQSYLGHSSLSMTMDIYTHLTEERSKSEMNKYEAYLDKLAKHDV